MGSLVFMRGDGAGSRAIRSPDRGWANHVGAVRSLAPGAKIIEALMGDGKVVSTGKRVWSAVRRKPFVPKPSGVVCLRTIAEAWQTNEIRVFNLPVVSEVDEDRWWSWLERQIGKSYDETAIAGFVASYAPFLKVLPFVGSKLSDAQIQSDRRAAQEFMCSELQKAGSDQRPHAPLQGQLNRRTDVYVEHSGVYVEPWRITPEVLMWSPLLTEVPASVWMPLVGIGR